MSLAIKTLYNKLPFNILKSFYGMSNTTVLSITTSYLVIIYIDYLSFSSRIFRSLIKLLNLKKYEIKTINQLISIFHHNLICRVFSHYTHNPNLIFSPSY